MAPMPPIERPAIARCWPACQFRWIRLANFDEVEGLPHRRTAGAPRIPPVRVPAPVAAIGHYDEQVRSGRELLDIGIVVHPS